MDAIEHKVQCLARRFILTNQSSTPGRGVKVGLHLVIAQLVDDQNQNLSLLRLTCQVMSQDGPETAVIIVPLSEGTIACKK